MGTFSNYYEVLTTETDEERRIQEKINEENDRFENTEECIEHRKIIEDLYKKNHDLFLKRIEAAKEVRPARLRSDWKKIDLNLKKEKEEDSVSFYADSLQESAAHGQWCPATDSFLTLESLNKEEYVTRDGKEIKLPYRTVIGKSY